MIIVFLFPDKKTKSGFCPPVSVIIPAHNEEKYIASTIRSVQSSEYKNKKEIIVVDDGSRDNTAKIVRDIAKKSRNVRVFSIKHSGKSEAINYGIRKAKFDIIAYVDADSALEKESLLRLVEPLAAENTAISSGIIRARPTNNPLSWFQDLDYIVSSSWRYVCSKLNAIYIAPGFAAFKKKFILKVGGFSKDTLTEDLDTTLVLRKAGYDAAMTKAVIFTSVPSTLVGLVRQRIRWGRGSIQSAKKHSDVIFSRKRGLFGIYTFPMHLFWYIFALIYMPFAIYWVITVYLSSSLSALGTILFIVKWFTVYGIADLFYNILNGSYTLTPLLLSIMTSWSLSFT
ncbi:MAG: glycosyltransferase family 2 protein, partial [Candidatus Aenigmatarchaeota archaeon]